MDTRRQLEEALAAAAAGNAQTQTQAQAQPQGQGQGQVDLPSAKRPRTAETTPPLPTVPHEDAEPQEATPQQDLFEYLAQRASGRKTLEARAQALASNNATLTKNLERSELEAARLRSDLASANAKFQVLESQFQAFKARASASLQREVKRAAELEVELNRAKGSASSPLNQPTVVRSSNETIIKDQDAEEGHNLQVSHLRLEVEKATMQLHEVKAESQDTIRSLEAQLETSKRWRDSDAQRIILLENQLTAAQSDISREAEARRRAEEQLLNSQASQALQTRSNVGSHEEERDADTEKEKDKDKDVLIKVLRERLTAVEEEAKDAADLKRRVSTMNFLQERLVTAESRARRAEAMLDAEQKVHLELEDVKTQLEAWTSIFAAFNDFGNSPDANIKQTPENLLHRVRRLQDALIKAKEESGVLGERLAEVNSQVQAARLAETLALNEKKTAMKRADAAEAAAARATRRAELAEQERDGFKAIVASYEEETKTFATEAGSTETKSPTSSMLRLEGLERAIHGLRNQLESCHTDLAAAIEAKQALQQDVHNAEERAARAEAEWRRVENEASELARQVQVLETRVARGEYNPETTRVLHLKSNPEAELSRATMEASLARLQAENETLKLMISRDKKSLAEQESRREVKGVSGVNDDEDGHKRNLTEDSEASALKIARLEGELVLLGRRLAEVQKTSDRLQQVFTRQISTFRDAIKGLFGYSVEMTSDPRVMRDVKAHFVLRPMYGEAGWELAFRMLKDGRIVMDPTDYSRRHLVREIETFVNRFRSIPALTANITMETFQRHTHHQE